MFLRDKVVKQSGKTYVYVQLVENFRDDDGITRQRVVQSLGPKTDALMASLKGYVAGRGVEADDFEILESRQFGATHVLRELWRELGLKLIFEDLADPREFQFDVGKALFTMVANRAVDPRSKLDTIEWARLDAFMPEVEGLDENHL